MTVTASSTDWLVRTSYSSNESIRLTTRQTARSSSSTKTWGVLISGEVRTSYAHFIVAFNQALKRFGRCAICEVHVKTTRPEPEVSKLRPVSPDPVLAEFLAISIKHEPLWSGSGGCGIGQRKQAGYPRVRCVGNWRGWACYGNRAAVGESHKPARRADPEFCASRE